MAIFDHPVWLFFLLLAVLLAVVEIGFRFAQRTRVSADEEFHSQIIGARTGIVTLVSFLLGFMLPLGLARFQERRHFVIEEAKAIGTTDLRADMLPEPVRSKAHALLREYVDVRLHFFQAGLQESELQTAQARSQKLHHALWLQGVAAAEISRDPITGLFAESLNQMIELSEESLAALEFRVPRAIWIVLVLISLLACLTVGYSLRRRFFLAMLVTPLMIAIVMALIADLDSPRNGLLQAGQQSMERLQSDLKPSP